MTRFLFAILMLSASLMQATATQFVFVDETGSAHLVQRAFVDKILREVPAEKIHIAMKHVAIRAVQMDNGEYALHAHVRGLGGGPTTGLCAYWGTKVTCWGGIVVLTWFQGPATLIELPELLAATESASNAALIAGTLLPTP
jgi:hypothetical protein